ncbi:Pesticidal crystal cry8Ba protein [Melia azedarach]|uniref:Pesticidal crystal cry8Ba protein n=1 Tax=Melia azedarach TaxID=155640 RepID=A0ACC1Z2S9_MELAZ|nr:Pesticidal crystal cry8Ba protein [Melia azedarach]
MFTDGLDESAINWVKQKSECADGEPRIRSPLAEKLPHDPFPGSPLLYNDNTSLLSPHGLPPLKFHSGLLQPHSVLAPRLYDGEDDDDVEEDESVASVSSNMDVDNFEEEDLLDKAGEELYNEDKGEMFGYKSCNIKLNRGLLNNLKIEVPESNRRFTDGDLGFKKVSQKILTPSGGSNISSQLRERVQLRNAQRSTSDANLKTMVHELDDMGTPSAPPITDVGIEEKSFEVESQIEQTGNGVYKSRESESFDGNKEVLEDWESQFQKEGELDERVNNTITGEKEEKMPYWQTSSLDNSPCYNTSDRYAWQTLVAYDACIRLCLFAWARGCTEAPEFLRDECLVLRSAFGLHKFLLQPRGVKPTEMRNTKSAEHVPTLKAKKVMGKIRVEVRKLRVIPRRKLKSTYSLRSAMYMQAGAEYVRHVSSLVKNGMNSLKLASFPMQSEDHLSCLFQLKSATEDTELEKGYTICLLPGSGDYHVFFPESEGDALLVEVQDKKNSIQGRATIPVSSLTDNPNDRIRWWPIYHDDQECVGKIQLSIGSTITSGEANQIKSGSVVETLAYDLLLEAAMRSQHFHSRNLRLQGTWKWLLTEFADYYGVSDSYTKLRYLLHVMNVATPTKDCLELVNELLVPILKAKSEKILTRHEKSMLLDCETHIESLLENVFENYKSLDENSPTGKADLFGSTKESVAPALAPAVRVYSLLHDILSQDAQTMLKNYLQTGAKKRCRKHMVETDEFVSTNSEGFLMDSITMSTAYLKIKNLCINISNEIQTDIKIHNHHILPSSIDLSNIAAAVYSSELCNRLRGFLAAWPASSPLPHVNELLVAVADFERDLESWNISPVQGGVDAKDLFHDYIMLWVEDMQLKLLDLCKMEKVPWAGVATNHSTSPFAEEMYEKIKNSLIEYEVVINRWPQYSLVLENAVANIERAIIKSLEKQYNDILTPLKDSIPKRLNLHVQKLTRRQSTTLYSVPSPLGTFLNTIKRILDILHCRVEGILKSWASFLPAIGDKKTLFGEQINGVTVLLRTKYKNYLQAVVEQLVSNMQANRSTRLKRILEEIKEEDGEADIREKMQMLSLQLIDSISNLHQVFTNRIFIAICRGFWDRMGQIVLKFLEGRKENRVWYNGSYYALGILDDTFASHMQRLQGNSLQEKDLEPPRSVVEARSILCRDAASSTDTSSYYYV